MSYDPTQPDQPSWGPAPYPYGQPYNVPGAGQPLPPGHQPAPPGYQPAPPGYQPAPPPPKRNTAPIVIGIVAATVIIIACCGIGAWVLQSAPNTTAGPSATATPSDSAPASPSAGGRPTIAPAGAPYSWQVPTGFQEITPPTLQRTGTTPKYTTAAAQSPAAATTDFLLVAAYPLASDVDNTTASELDPVYDKIVKDLGQDPSTRQDLTTNGYRALRYTFTSGQGGAYSYFIFKHTTQLQVICQWTNAEPAIKTGCQDLLNTISIT